MFIFSFNNSSFEYKLTFRRFKAAPKSNISMNSILVLLLTMIASLFSLGIQTKDLMPLESTVHNWNLLNVQQTKTGEYRQILDGKSMIFEQLEIHVTTLNPGKAPHGSHTHQDFEELVIVKEGKIKQTIGTKEKILGPGSIVLATPGNEHGLSNAGDSQASYYIIKWRTNDFSASITKPDQTSLMLD